MQAAAAAQSLGNIVQGVGGLLAGNANSKALKKQARETLQQGSAEETRIREAARATMGDQIAAQFSNGFQGGTGSALDALRESKINATLDALEIRRQAMGKAAALRAEAKQQKLQGKLSLLSGILGAGTSVAKGKADWADARRGQSGGG
ncbi:hypothetical protein [Sphingorhabdus sp.]|jgi:hypothetical protein|uniref:hypothetical protein n=1 Tax=Sphingorhabdus sp. TaxID=1902408 RepID=UPI0037CB41A2